MLTWPRKSAVEAADYGIDWEPRLGDDVIVTSTWTLVDAAGVTKSDESIGDGDQTTFVKITGGTEGERASILNTVVTAAGHTLVEEVSLAIGYRDDLPMTLEAMMRRLQIETIDLDADAVAQIEDSVEDAMVSAIDFLEDQTKLVLIRREVARTYARWPYFPLALDVHPVRDLVGISYVNESGDVTVWAEENWLWSLRPDGVWLWHEADIVVPDLHERHPAAVTITLDAGYDPVGGENPPPPRLVQALVLLTGHWYNHTDLAKEGRSSEIEVGATTIVDSVRMFR